MLRTTTKKFYTELMNQPGSNMWGWNVARVLYRSVDEDGPTHALALICNGPPQGTLETSLADSVMKKVSGLDPAEYRKR